MRCKNPSCNYFKTYITDSRVAYEGKAHRRKHTCHKCGTSYRTYETILEDEEDNLLHWFNSAEENKP